MVFERMRSKSVVWSRVRLKRCENTPATNAVDITMDNNEENTKYSFPRTEGHDIGRIMNSN